MLLRGMLSASVAAARSSFSWRAPVFSRAVSGAALTPSVTELPSAPNLTLDEQTRAMLLKQQRVEESKSLYADLRAPNKRLPVVKLLTGEPTGEMQELNDGVFATPVRVDIVHRVIQWQEKNARKTLYKAKSRNEVQGGGRKPWKQKGTGKARAGSIRSPLWVGGGVAHPPKLREWGHLLQKRVRRLGMRCALAAKYRDLRLTIVDSLELPAAKTKSAVAVLQSHSVVPGRRVLFINAENPPEAFSTALRNVPKAKALAQVGANVRDIVMADRVFITPGALSLLTARLLRED